jgi:hypothetical protein
MCSVKMVKPAKSIQGQRDGPAGCALTIEKKLTGIPGVHVTSVNFANETVVMVDYDSQIINLS